jgi:hypothetical protein
MYSFASSMLYVIPKNEEKKTSLKRYPNCISIISIALHIIQCVVISSNKKNPSGASRCSIFFALNFLSSLISCWTKKAYPRPVDALTASIGQSIIGYLQRIHSKTKTHLPQHPKDQVLEDVPEILAWVGFASHTVCSPKLARLRNGVYSVHKEFLCETPCLGACVNALRSSHRPDLAGSVAGSDLQPERLAWVYRVDCLEHWSSW